MCLVFGLKMCSCFQIKTQKKKHSPLYAVDLEGRVDTPREPKFLNCICIKKGTILYLCGEKASFWPGEHMESVPQLEEMFLLGLTILCHPLILKLPQPDLPKIPEAPLSLQRWRDTMITHLLPSLSLSRRFLNLLFVCEGACLKHTSPQTVNSKLLLKICICNVCWVICGLALLTPPLTSLTSLIFQYGLRLISSNAKAVKDS